MNTKNDENILYYIPLVNSLCIDFHVIAKVFKKSFSYQKI